MGMTSNWQQKLRQLVKEAQENHLLSSQAARSIAYHEGLHLIAFDDVSGNLTRDEMRTALEELKKITAEFSDDPEEAEVICDCEINHALKPDSET